MAYHIVVNWFTMTRSLRALRSVTSEPADFGL